MTADLASLRALIERARVYTAEIDGTLYNFGDTFEAHIDRLTAERDNAARFARAGTLGEIAEEAVEAVAAFVARKVAEAVEAERPKWQRAHTLWAENVAAERDAAHAAIREWSSAVDMFQRSFTVETSSRLLAAEDALRALLPPVAAHIGEEAGE